MRYIMHIEIPDEELEGDESIENAARLVDRAIDTALQGSYPFAQTFARPLSEIIAC